MLCTTHRACSSARPRGPGFESCSKYRVLPGKRRAHGAQVSDGFPLAPSRLAITQASCLGSSRASPRLASPRLASPLASPLAPPRLHSKGWPPLESLGRPSYQVAVITVEVIRFRFRLCAAMRFPDNICTSTSTLLTPHGRILTAQCPPISCI